MTDIPPNLTSTFTPSQRDKAVCPAPKPSDYLSDLDDMDMTEAQKTELLQTLFSIMKSFVDMGYGLDPVNKLISRFENSARDPMILVNCQDTHPDNTAQTDHKESHYE